MRVPSRIMNTQVFSIAVAAIACALFSGCDYGVPLTSQPTRGIDPRLLGNWHEQGETPDVLKIRKLDDKTYIATVDGDVYRVYHSDFAGRPFVTVQDLNSPERNYCYYFWNLSRDETELTLLRVGSKILPENVTTVEEAQRVISDNLGNPKLLENPAVFVRERHR